MHTLGSLLTVLAALVLLVAVANIIYPVKVMRIPTRKHAWLVLVASLVALTLGGTMLDDQPARTVDDTAMTHEETPVPTDGDPAPTVDRAAVTRDETSPPAGGGRQAPASEAAGVILAAWEEPAYDPNLKRDTMRKRALVYQEGEILLHFGNAGGLEVIERPSEEPNQRKFDLQPDSDRSEYLILMDSGVLRFFSWDGREFKTALATTVHPDILAIGANPVSEECVPKALVATSKETVRLYEQLRAFKDDPEFARRGFSTQGPYNSWLEATLRLGGPGDESWEQLGFTAIDVYNLGMDYMQAARGRRPSTSIADMERKIKAGISRATCGIASGTAETNSGAR